MQTHYPNSLPVSHSLEIRHLYSDSYGRNTPVISNACASCSRQTRDGCARARNFTIREGLRCYIAIKEEVEVPEEYNLRTSRDKSVTGIFEFLFYHSIQVQSVLLLYPSSSHVGARRDR